MTWERLSTNRDMLYGIAIGTVLFHHMTYITHSGLLGYIYMYLRSIGALGVDMFLLLGGMGCCRSWRKSSSIIDFYHKRLRRILPAYCLIIGLYDYIQYIVVKKEGVSSFLYHFSTLSYWLEGKGFWFVPAVLALYFLFPHIYIYI